MPPRLRLPTPSFLLPTLPTTLPLRPATLSIFRTYAAQGKSKGQKEKEALEKKRKKKSPAQQWFTQYDLKDAEQFTLTDAMRYLRAFEIGYDPTSVKYDLAVKLKTQRSGPTVKSRIRLPHAVKTGERICVIAKSPMAEKAKAAGATVVGFEDVIKNILDGNINFEKVICHEPVYAEFTKSRVGRILGPKQMMPSPKTGTVVKDPAAAIKELAGANDYREKLGVVRIAIGQLGYTEAQLAENIKAFMQGLKRNLHQLSYQAEKGITEVVLSSTHGPGFSLTGDIKQVEEGELETAAAELAAAEAAKAQKQAAAATT